MSRIIGGGVWLLVLLFVSFNTDAQIRLMSAADGKPVRDVIVNFSGFNNESMQSAADSGGVVKFPLFPVYHLTIVAPGFQLVHDTLHGETQKTYTLIPLQVEMHEVVITGQYHASEATQSVYDVQVFDQKSIELRAANNLSDLLQYENSILISRDPFLGAGININGISGNNVKILIDGVPVIGRENGNVDIAQLDLSNIERVELVRGPMSETYGSDALAGVINLISKKKRNDGVSGGAKLYYETNGTYNANAFGSVRKKRHELSLNLGRNFFDGYSQWDTSRAQLWKPKEQYFSDLGYAYHFKKASIRYNGSIAREKLISKGNVIATPYEAYAFDDYYTTFRLTNKLFADIELGNHAALNFTNAFSNYERSRDSYRKDMVLLKQSGLQSNDYTNMFRQYLFRGTYSTFKSWKKINYQIGYDITLDEARGDRTGPVTRRINDYAVFGSAEITFVKKMVIRPAVRAIFNSAYPAPFVPSLHIRYDPFKTVTIRASAARGFRAPSVKELYLDFEDSNHNLTGNPELKPELSDYFQLAFDVHKKIKDVNISVNPGLYFNHIYNKISLAQINSNALEYTYINVDEFRNIGGDINLGIESRNLSLRGGVNLTAYHTGLETDPHAPPYRKTVNLNSSISYSLEKAGVTAGLFFKRFGRVTIYTVENEQVQSYFVKGYNTLDFTLSKTLFNKAVTLSAGMKNIFNNISTNGNPDENNVHGDGDQVTLIGMGRFYFAGLQFRIGKN